MMGPTISGDISGKKIILRVDLNSPIRKGKVVDNARIEEAAKSIDFFKRKGARVIVLSHQGRKGEKDFASLKEHAKFLNEKTKIKFVPDIFGKRAIARIKKLRNGRAILLENVRTLDEEVDFNDKAEYVLRLSVLADLYVNDAFSVSHRRQASVVLFPEYLPSFIGPLFASEIAALDKLKIKNALYILAGSKAEENALFLKKGKKIIVAGIFGQMCLHTRGLDFGKQNEFFDADSVKLLKGKLKGVKLIAPVDFAVDMKGKRAEIRKEDFPNQYEIFDIGRKSIEEFCKEIRKAKVIFMKGPAGYIEDEKFAKGTRFLLEEIAKSKAYSVIGGGHLATALSEMNIKKDSFNHVSLSGGAFASYIAGKKLPGLSAILEQKKRAK